MQADRIEDLALRNRRLAELRDSPAWAELQSIADEAKERQFKLLTRSFMNGQPVDQRYVDRMAGYFKGMEDLLGKPEMLEAKLKSALKKAELIEEGE